MCRGWLLLTFLVENVLVSTFANECDESQHIPRATKTVCRHQVPVSQLSLTEIRVSIARIPGWQILSFPIVKQASLCQLIEPTMRRNKMGIIYTNSVWVTILRGARMGLEVGSKNEIQLRKELANLVRPSWRWCSSVTNLNLCRFFW